MCVSVFLKKISFILPLFLILGALSVHGMEATTVAPLGQVNNENNHEVCSLFPCKYVHRDVQTQIKNYRAIYDAIPNRGIGVYSGVHIPGLFNVLKNGFALVADFVKDNAFQFKKISKGPDAPEEFDYVPNEERRQEYYYLLEKLYHIAMILEKESKMTQDNFLKFNILLAVIVDQYKGVKLGDYRVRDAQEDEVPCPGEEEMQGKEEEGDYSEFSEILVLLRKHKLGFYHTISQVEELMREDGFPTDDWWIIRDEDENILDEQFFPAAIIYTNLKKTGISPATFVDQALHESYGMGMALFKVESFPISKPMTEAQYKENQRQRAAHGGVFSGTYNLLDHDIAHTLEQCSLEYDLKEAHNLDWRKRLQYINQIRKKHLLENLSYKETPAYQILTDGLFLLSHELLNISGGRLPWWIESQGGLNLQSVISYISDEIMQQIFYQTTSYCKKIAKGKKGKNGEPIYKIVKRSKQAFPRHSLSYRQEFKDHEFVLKNKRDINHNPFLPQNFDRLDTNWKEHHIMKGYGKFWQDFMKLANGG